MLLSLILLLCSIQIVQSRDCWIRDSYHRPGNFIKDCAQCRCNYDGSWRCEPRCVQPAIQCYYPEKVTLKKDVEVTAGCYCDKYVCEDPTPHLVCNVHGERYAVGSFINRCRACTCNQDGSWVCPDQCKRLYWDSITCSINERKDRRRVMVLNTEGCYCDELYCKPKNKIQVAATRFVNEKCKDVQSPNKCLRWRAGGYCYQGNKYEKYMMKNCYKTCTGCATKTTKTPSTTESKPCTVYGQRYAVGSFTSKCRHCTCRADGSWTCPQQCNFPTHISCPYGTIVKREEIEDEKLKGCSCTKLSCEDRTPELVCEIDGVRYAVGNFTDKSCRKCECSSDGSWSCSDLCKSYFIFCNFGEELKKEEVQVEPGCSCQNLVCVKKEKTECTVDGKKYAIGSFIDKCRKCTCNDDGTYNCDLKCPPQKIKCQPGQKQTITQEEVSDGCFCPQIQCDSYPIVCTLGNDTYTAGPFRRNCRDCICKDDGSWSCKPLCTKRFVVCKSDEKIEEEPEEVSPGCFCPKSVCKKKLESASGGCVLDGITYEVGEFIHKCESCTCTGPGAFYCERQCGYDEPECVPGQYGHKYKEEVSPGCFCTKMKCFLTKEQARLAGKVKPRPSVVSKQKAKIRRRCTYEGYSYPFGTRFANKACTKKCSCITESSVFCSDLCAKPNRNCPPNQKLYEYKKHFPSSTCYCVHTMCLSKYH